MMAVHRLVVLGLIVVTACNPRAPVAQRAATACHGPAPSATAEPGRQVVQATGGQGTQAIAFGANGLVALSMLGSIQIWNLQTRTLLRRLTITGNHYLIAWSGADTFVAATGSQYDTAGRAQFVEYDLSGHETRQLSSDWRVLKTSSGGQLQRVVANANEITVQRLGGVERHVSLPGWRDEAEGRLIAPMVSTNDRVVAIVSYDNSKSHDTILHVWQFSAGHNEPRTFRIPGIALRMELTADGANARLEVDDFVGDNPGPTGSVVLVNTSSGAIAKLGPWDVSWATHDYTSTVVSPDGKWAATVPHEVNHALDAWRGAMDREAIDALHRDDDRLALTATTVEGRRTDRPGVVWRWTSTFTDSRSGEWIANVQFPSTAPVAIVSLGGGQTVVLDRERGTVLGRLGAMPAVAKLMAASDAQHLVVLLDERRVVQWNLASATTTELGDIDLGDRGVAELTRAGIEVAMLDSPGPGSVEIDKGTFEHLPAQGATLELPGDTVRAVSIAEGVALVDAPGPSGAQCRIVDLTTRTRRDLDAFDSACSVKVVRMLKNDHNRISWSFQGGHAIAYWTVAGGERGRTTYTRVVSVWDYHGTQELFELIPTTPAAMPQGGDDGKDTVGIFDLPQMTVLSSDRGTIAMANNTTLWRITIATHVVATEDIGAPIASLAWLPGGDLLVSRNDGVVERHGKTGVERGSGVPLAIFTVSPDGKWFAGPGTDGTAQVWTTSPLASAATLVGFADHEYLAYTQDGYYAGTADVADRVAWVFDHPYEGFSFEQYAAEFQRPDIITARLSGKPAGAALARRPPRITLGNPTINGGIAHVRASVTAPGRVDVVRFFVDGRPAGAVPVCAASGVADGALGLHAGINRITGVAYDANGLASRWESIDVTGPPATSSPKLWIVAVGVSRYPKLAADQQLEAAGNDARTLADAFRRQVKHGAYRDIDATVLVDGDATTDRVLAALRRLDSMSPDDLAVVFMAGHGIKPSGDAGDMVFLTSEVSADHLDRGIRWRDVAGALGRARGRVIVLLDACHAGHFTRDLVAPADDLASAFASDGRAGALVFSAAKGRQFSYEPTAARGLELRHRIETPVSQEVSNNGFFTAALVAALDDPNTDLDHDGEIELSEWITTVTEAVTSRSGGNQTPWVARREIHGDLRVGVSRR